ncbi:hypothetical protein QQP08_003661 [Theobroma cacao]|nr:hypothetical protein QQP08_003661 [Theobroma cacao]
MGEDGVIVTEEELLNEKKTKNMLNTEASNTFITPRKVKRYSLKVEKDFGQMKVVNSLDSAIMGNSKNVKIKINSWEGSVNLIIATIDDFEFVLGLDFMTKA